MKTKDEFFIIGGVIITIIIGFFIIIGACNITPTSPTPNTVSEKEIKPKIFKINPISNMDYLNTLQLIEIDSCEYLYGNWGSSTVLAHKGNCKYCIERTKKSSK